MSGTITERPAGATNEQIIAVLKSQHAEITRRLDVINGTLKEHDGQIDELQVEQGKLSVRQKVMGGGFVALGVAALKAVFDGLL